MENRTVAFSLMVLFSMVGLGLGLGLGRRIPVGGRMKVIDVKSNQEIQELGRYCVQRYNLQQQASPEETNSDNIGPLKFKEVVEAEKQVVSGIKYYLKIDAKSSVGIRSMFDAVVLVKPWARSKELLHFDQSSSHASKEEERNFNC